MLPGSLRTGARIAMKSTCILGSNSRSRCMHAVGRRVGGGGTVASGGGAAAATAAAAAATAARRPWAVVAARPLPLWAAATNGMQHRSLMHVAAAAGPGSSGDDASDSSSGSGGRGLPFALSRPYRPLRFPWGRRLSGAREEDMQIEVDAMVEGSPALPGSAAPSREELTALLRRVQADCAAAVPLALAAKKQRNPRWPLPALASVSLVLCDDAYIRALNAAHRGKDAPTDVLSFEVPDEPGEVPPPVKLLGDLVISLDTAARQAAERGYGLEDELRVLLAHGALHLVGFDHEAGGDQLEEMAAAEAAIMERLGWRGQGLIEAATSGAEEEDDDDGDNEEDASSGGSASPAGKGPGSSGGTSSSGGSRNAGSSSASTSSSSNSSSGGRASQGQSSASGASSASSSSGSAKFRSSAPRLVAIDMDGTLLDSRSRVLPSSVEAIKAALARGVRVVLATGKARPAAIAACEAAGLAGDALLVSRRTPGVFLQGLAVHGRGGAQLSDAALPPAVVARALAWAADARVACAAFLGDACATLELTPELVELHERYYEPLARVAPGIDALLAGPPVRKLLFMADEARVAREVAPFWRSALGGGGGGGGDALAGAEAMQAVPSMLEVVPRGVNKWAGLGVLMGHLGVAPGDLMAIGDGGNDAEMVRNAGLGVAMANAVPETLAAASAVVSSNDDDGVAEAIERFVL